MPLVQTDYGLIYNTDGTLCATLRPDEGRFGGAVAVEEGTTNQVSAASRHDVNGWTTQNHTDAGTKETEFGQRTVWQVTQNGYAYLTMSSISGTYTDGDLVSASIYIWVNKNVRLSLRLFDNHNYHDLKAGRWNRLTATEAYKSNPDFTAVFLIDYRMSTIPDGLEVMYWGAQFEAKPFPTSFVDGTRAAGVLMHLAKDIINPAAGTIHLYLQTPVLDENWFLWDTSVNRHHAFYRDSTGKLDIFWNNSVRMSAALPPDKAWHTITVRWQGEQTSLLIDGEDKATGTIPGGIKLADGELFTWGSRYNYANQATKLIDELLILPYDADEQEIQSWYQNGITHVRKPGYYASFDDSLALQYWSEVTYDYRVQNNRVIFERPPKDEDNILVFYETAVPNEDEAGS